MEISQIRSFLEIVNAGSMNKAAERLCISQPALSISIRRMEEELGARVFLRNGKKLTLSPFGEKILPLCEQITLAETRILEMGREEREGESTVKIAVLAGSPLIPDLILSLRNRFPGTDIQVVQTDELGANTPDFILCSSAQEAENKDTRVLLHERYMIAVPKNHRFSGREVLTAGDLQSEEMIGLTHNSSMSEFEEYYQSEYGVQLRRSIECNNAVVLRELVSKGIGITLVREKTWLFQKDPSIRLVPLEDPWDRYILLKETGFRKLKIPAEQYADCLKTFFQVL